MYKYHRCSWGFEGSVLPPLETFAELQCGWRQTRTGEGNQLREFAPRPAEATACLVEKKNEVEVDEQLSGLWTGSQPTWTQSPASSSLDLAGRLRNELNTDGGG